MSRCDNTHEKLVKKALSDDEVKQAYDALEIEFKLIKAMIKARNAAGKTQCDVANDMCTTTSVIGRLETGGGKGRHSPTLETLKKYAKAVNCQLQIKLIPFKPAKKSHKL
ncbi:MAG: helix-turn-helix transcriptional regulator [Pseudomonadota bacterium]